MALDTRFPAGMTVFLLELHPIKKEVKARTVRLPIFIIKLGIAGLM